MLRVSGGGAVWWFSLAFGLSLPAVSSVSLSGFLLVGLSGGVVSLRFRPCAFPFLPLVSLWLGFSLRLPRRFLVLANRTPTTILDRDMS